MDYPVGAAFQPRSCALNDLNGFNDLNRFPLTAYGSLFTRFSMPSYFPGVILNLVTSGLIVHYSTDTFADKLKGIL